VGLNLLDGGENCKIKEININGGIILDQYEKQLNNLNRQRSEVNK
jgi:hypothetical protein